MIQLFESSSYLAPIDYIVSRYIREYDIAKANINILLYKGLISKKQYDYFYSLDKKSREIQVGILQGNNKGINIGLQKGFKEMMKMFFEANDIKNYEVLSIKKDAVYLIDRIPTISTFSNIDFIAKNTYTSYYRINRLEMYYYCNASLENIDIKGMNKESLTLHKEYMLDFILTLFYSAQHDKIEETIELIKVFYEQYINFNLDVGYYRNFDNTSRYLYKAKSLTARFSSDSITENQKRYLDISYNLIIIQSLYKIYTNIYFQTKNKG